jgi:hypothetical protein
MYRPQTRLSPIALMSSLALLASPGFAQEAEDLEMSQYQFAGVVNTDNVYVRSGASESDYPIIRLNRDARVVVVGAKQDWLKILPPEGTFCLVGKAWVDRRGDGTVGRVREGVNNAVNVRVGSTLNNMVAKIVYRFKGGEDVRIVAEQDEWLKIAPPPGVFVYVHKKFVNPEGRVDVVNNNGSLVVQPTDKPANVPSDTRITPAPSPAPSPGNGNAALPDDRNAIPAAPTTGPAAEVAAAQAKFDALEAQFDAASKQSIEEQPLDEMLAGYKAVAANRQLPESILRTAEFRVKSVEVRKKALASFLETKRMREEMAAKSVPLAAEQQEITQRLKETEVTRYTAVGTLQTSAIQLGSRKMYRLTDPASGRTVVYVVSDDPAVARNLGAFVGVRGQITDDTARRLKYIEPTEMEGVDRAAVTGGRVSSVLTPASMMPAAVSQ